MMIDDNLKQKAKKIVDDTVHVSPTITLLLFNQIAHALQDVRDEELKEVAKEYKKYEEKIINLNKELQTERALVDMLVKAGQYLLASSAYTNFPRDQVISDPKRVEEFQESLEFVTKEREGKLVRKARGIRGHYKSKETKHG